jgi:hypothetical protein
MYVGIAANLYKLLSAYGGPWAFLKSPYVHLSVILAAICIKSGRVADIEKLTIAVMPNLLGFSIGAYAIIFGVLGERILNIMAKKEEDEKHSMLSTLSASFGYFVLVQCCTLIFSVFTSIFELNDLRFLLYNPSTTRDVLVFSTAFLRSFLLFYSLLLFISITLEIFRITTFREL